MRIGKLGVYNSHAKVPTPDAPSFGMIYKYAPDESVYVKTSDGVSKIISGGSGGGAQWVLGDGMLEDLILFVNTAKSELILDVEKIYLIGEQEIESGDYDVKIIFSKLKFLEGQAFGIEGDRLLNTIQEMFPVIIELNTLLNLYQIKDSSLVINAEKIKATACGFTVEECLNLIDISLPNLVSIKSLNENYPEIGGTVFFSINSCPEFDGVISAPLLTEILSSLCIISFESCDELDNLSFPENLLKNVQNSGAYLLGLSSNNALSQSTLQSFLDSVATSLKRSHYLSISNQQGVESLDFGVATEVGDIFLNLMDDLNSINMSNIVHVGSEIIGQNTGSIEISNCPNLSSIVVSSVLENCYRFEMIGTAVTDVQQIDAILSAIDAGGRTDGYVDVSGGTNGPASDILISALQAKGFTVIANANS
jgi:hypothetical protein